MAIIKAKYSSAWDPDARDRCYIITTDCEVDLETGVVEAEAASDEESDGVEIKVREYIEIDDREFEVEDDKVVDLQGLRDFVAAQLTPTTAG